MSDEFRKFAYCSNCSKNVPHCRTVNDQHQHALRWVLEVLRIGPWYCLHCQRKRLVLPAVRGDASDYRIVQPNDPVDPSKPAIWSFSCLGDSDYVNDSEMAVSGDDFNRFDKHNGITEQSGLISAEVESVEQQPVEPVNQPPVNGTASEDPIGLAINGDALQDIGDEENSKPIPVEVIGHLNGASSPVLEARPSQAEGTVEVDTASPQTTSNQPAEIIQVEPVGNFIKDQSLALKASRVYRFTEKYRDSVVDRILAGKIQISTLTSDGMYTEAELVSWIADKTKRQNKKIETLELDTDPRWSDQRRQSSYGPFG